MAKYNEILVGRYNRLFQKLFQMKGGAPAPQLAGDIQPSFQLFSGIENRYLESWNRFAVGAIQGAGVGVNSAARLRNPANSNVIAVVEQIIVSQNQAERIFLDGGATGADLAAVDVTRPIDARQQNVGAVLQSSHATGQGAITSNWYDFFTAANTVVPSVFLMTHENMELPILPGNAIQIRTNALNTNLLYTWLWRERFLEESERT